MKVLLTLFFILSLLKADEISRIDVIVSEITHLRSDYDECKKELKFKSKSLIAKIHKLEKELKIKNNLLKTKDKIIKKLRKEENYFPKLMMKDKFVKDNQELLIFKARAYHLKYDSIIYDKINGKKISKWEKSTSFTSSVKTKSWIKITGYFINRKWTKAKKEMWVKIQQVEKK